MFHEILRLNIAASNILSSSIEPNIGFVFPEFKERLIVVKLRFNAFGTKNYPSLLSIQRC